MIPPRQLSFPVLSLTYPSELRHPGYGVTVPMTTHVGLCVTSPDQQTLNFCSKVKSFPKHGGTKESFTERHISEKDETLRWGRWSHNDRWKIWSKGGRGQATAETQPAPDFCVKKNDMLGVVIQKATKQLDYNHKTFRLWKKNPRISIFDGSMICSTCIYKSCGVL